ncbi:MAG: GyrI-like domain-containing protein [Kofleriaceae bacterium]|nr:GyrI-like domain-containing protein [Kofleriaceae bacterium]
MNLPTLSAATHYTARFRSVLAYIDTHLDGDVSVAALSSVASSSKFHFHRQFTALFGIGVYKYVQLRRLRRAADQLAFRTELTVLTIALSNGYDGPEAFARAFKKTTGQSPTQFRQQPCWDSWPDHFAAITRIRSEHMSPTFQLDDVTIIATHDIMIATFEHRGDPRRIGESVRRFIAWRKANQLAPRVSATFNILWDNPDQVPADEYRFDLGAAVTSPVAPNSDGIITKIIPGGRCATLRHVGSDDTLFQAVNFMYQTWLPQSGAQLRDFPLYLQRVAFAPEVAPDAAVTDIFLPIT